jgi:hypothetical protein
MGEAKFTPGPWHPYFAGRNDTTVYAAGKTVAEIIARPEDGDGTDQQDANTFLIAAAPELYDALKVFAAEPLSTEPGHDRARLFSFEDPDEKIRRARAAIAKAEGRG